MHKTLTECDDQKCLMEALSRAEFESNSIFLSNQIEFITEGRQKKWDHIEYRWGHLNKSSWRHNIVNEVTPFALRFFFSSERNGRRANISKGSGTHHLKIWEENVFKRLPFSIQRRFFFLSLSEEEKKFLLRYFFWIMYNGEIRWSDHGGLKEAE